MSILLVSNLHSIRQSPKCFFSELCVKVPLLQFLNSVRLQPLYLNSGRLPCGFLWFPSHFPVSFLQPQFEDGGKGRCCARIYKQPGVLCLILWESESLYFNIVKLQPSYRLFMNTSTGEPLTTLKFITPIYWLLIKVVKAKQTHHVLLVDIWTFG